jgi:uncharacterized protein (DUF58 family)
MLYFHAKGTTSLALFLFVVGIVLGNIVLLTSGFVLIIFIAFALAVQQPTRVSIKRDPRDPTSSFVGQVIERNALVSVESGVGPVIVNDPIPEQFELVEGSNYKMFWKGLHSFEVKMAYRIKCTKRGNYQLFAPSYESRHPLNMRDVSRGGREPEGTLTVRPKLMNIRRMRDPRTMSRIPLPIGSVAKGGLPTTDFRELKEYTPDDPYNSINWKATARFCSRGSRRPYVNVFEKEGRKIVWLILDVSIPMSIGTTVRNALDHAVEAADALSYFYLERGCSVGLYACTKQGVLRPPDTGRRQYRVLLKDLIAIQTTTSPQPLAAAAERCGKYSIGTNPMFIIITCLIPASSPSVVRGVKEALKYMRMARGRYSVIVVDVNPYGLLAKREEERLGSEAMKVLTNQESRAIARSGALIVRWDPAKQDFSRVMLRGMKR